jgi:1,4-dihydroxy-6-naphthoate synthase
MQHVDLYVNDWTMDLGTVGKNALQQLSQRAQSIGLVPLDAPELQIFAAH